MVPKGGNERVFRQAVLQWAWGECADTPAQSRIAPYAPCIPSYKERAASDVQ
jgi:hypothetical protein